VSVMFAHVGGIPLEEGLLAIAPATGALAVLVGAHVGRVAGWLRRR
jgi:hypothetical protein